MSSPFGSEVTESESPEGGSGSGSDWLCCCCRVWYLVWDLVCRTGRGAGGVLLPLVLGLGLGSGSRAVSEGVSRWDWG